MPPDAQLVSGLATALGVGLLVGIERERRKGQEPNGIAAGVRTHALLALSGAVAWLLGPWMLVLGAVAVTALVVASYGRTASTDPGLTGEVAMLLTFLLGALALQHAPLAAGLGVLVAAYLGLYLAAGARLDPQATFETLAIRALGSAAFLALHVVLCIGPLCRLDARFLPLLYNRRHLGVVTCLLALGHGGFALFQFHALGDVHPLVSLLTAEARWDSLPWFPFQPLGLAALAILVLMAATSHDFWLKNLGPKVWKSLHMMVYVAYALLVLHVMLGVVQQERGLAGLVLVGLGITTVTGLHLRGRRAGGRSPAEVALPLR